MSMQFPNKHSRIFSNASKTAIKYAKNSLTLSSILKGLGLFIVGDYIGKKVEQKFRPKTKKELKKYMYKKPNTEEELKQLAKTAALGFVPFIGDFSSGFYNGYVTSRTKGNKK